MIDLTYATTCVKQVVWLYNWLLDNWLFSDDPRQKKISKILDTFWSRSSLPWSSSTPTRCFYSPCCCPWRWPAPTLPRPTWSPVSSAASSLIMPHSSKSFQTTRLWATLPTSTRSSSALSITVSSIPSSKPLRLLPVLYPWDQ